MMKKDPTATVDITAEEAKRLKKEMMEEKMRKTRDETKQKYILVF